MNQILQTPIEDTILHKSVYPAICSGYPKILKRTYDNTQNQKEISRKLYRSYLVKGKPQGKQYVEIDYAGVQIQNVYVMKHFLPHSLLVPFALDSLSRSNKSDPFSYTTSELLKSKSLTISLFGGGPCPELYGLRHYLKKHNNIAEISSAVLDKTKWRVAMKTERFFKTDLAGTMGSFLHPVSEGWVRKSDLIVIQNCLNEIPGSGFSYNLQLLRNMNYIVNLMKPGALMLVIERYGYKLVTDLFKDFRSNLNGFNDVQASYTDYEKLEFEDLNNNVNISDEKIEYLDSNWLWMSNHIQFHWLAISKQ